MRKEAAMKKEEIFTQIAQQHLNIETLVERKSDSLDFHEVAVWCVRDALEAAYEAGRKARK
jgi:predicted metal-dependent hydrolase